jgi:predicted thioredoxin/glutaredoxin
MRKGFQFMSEYADEEYGWEPKPHVMIDGDWVPMDNVQFENIEEDMLGRDTVTVTYNGERFKSLVTLR